MRWGIIIVLLTSIVLTIVTWMYGQVGSEGIFRSLIEFGVTISTWIFGTWTFYWLIVFCIFFFPLLVIYLIGRMII